MPGIKDQIFQPSFTALMPGFLFGGIMRKLIVIFTALIGLGSYFHVSADSKIASEAARQVMPVPTFSDVHRAYFRIVANEAPFYSMADHDGILQALLFGGGGRHWLRGETPGTGYGLDYSKLMKRMIAHSPRTFPANSKFLLLNKEGRERHRARQTSRNLWSSSLQLNCAEPKGWAQFMPKPVNDWQKLFGKRCRFAVRSTELFLKGFTRSHCTGKPTTWGNEKDTYRPGGPFDSGWKEIFCDRDRREKCEQLSREARLNSKVCAKNRFWSWLKK
jgi:hypothetical protein